MTVARRLFYQIHAIGLAGVVGGEEARPSPHKTKSTCMREGGGSQAACIAKSKIILNLLLHCRTINQKTNMFVSLFRFLYRVCTTKTNKKECFH